MNAYRVGTYYEEKSMQWCLDQGAVDCVSSKGSHGLWDFVADYPDRVEFIQVKKSKVPTLRVLYAYARSLAKRRLKPSDQRRYRLHVWEAYASGPKVYPLICTVEELIRRFPENTSAIAQYAAEMDKQERQEEARKADLERRRAERAKRKKARLPKSPPTDGASPGPEGSPGFNGDGARPPESEARERPGAASGPVAIRSARPTP